MDTTLGEKRGAVAAKRDFLEIPDFSREELTGLLRKAAELKTAPRGREGAGAGELPLAGRTLAMIFRKSSTRTRVSFEAGMHQLGGHAIFLSDRDSQMGRGETVHDTARVLSGYVDGIMIRTFAHDEIRELARHATVPVINGLTDLLHPCQVLADVFTAAEVFDPAARPEELGRGLSDLTFAWVGDGNNMANSWLNASRSFGFPLRLACPEGYDPDPEILKRASDEGAVLLTRDPREAAEGAHVVTTDVWASMGQEEEAARRAVAFAGFQVDEALMALADPKAIFLHCLPAHRGEEVSAGVMDGPRSFVFLEAENRLHVQKALLLELMGKGR
jgi:ornithine carbamoyltransferase